MRAPEGIATLSEAERAILEADHRVMRQAIELLDTASVRGAATVWTHPYPSYAWQQPQMVEWGERSGSVILDTDMCEFGGKWKQRLGAAINPRALNLMSPLLGRKCPGQSPQHKHQVPRTRGVPSRRLAGIEAKGRPEEFQHRVAEGLQCVLESRKQNVLPQPKKARARCRNPWEERLGDLCEVLPWKVEWAWHESAREGKKLPHINVLELRGRGMVARRLARRVTSHHHRAIAMGDSRVALGAGAKGRSGSGPVNNELRKFLPDLFGGDIFLTSFWIESARNPSDNPSRKKPVDKPRPGKGRILSFLSGAAPLLSPEELRTWRRGEWRSSPPPPLGRQEVEFSGGA